MSYKISPVILAAGEGTRMKMADPKPLAPLLGKRMMDYPLQEAHKFMVNNGLKGKLYVVTGFAREKVEAYLGEKYSKGELELAFVHQQKQIGTANALTTYFEGISEAAKSDYTLVMCADTPLICRSELEQMFQIIVKEKLDGVAASFIAPNPHGYGRIVRGKKKVGFHIVEEKDANPKTKKITEVNSGLYIFKTSFVTKHLGKIGTNNKAGEFYLTDLFQDKFKVKALNFGETNIFAGVNTLEQLEDVGAHLRERKNRELRDSGVRFIDSRHSYIDFDVTIGKGTLVYPHVFVSGNSTIGQNVVLETGVVVVDSVIDDSAQIHAYSHLEKAKVKSKANIGPFARLRSGSNIGESAKIGNFVEIKQSTLEKESKVSHLSYVGDAIIGEETNIGCGFITCNYDGANKHLTKIGKNCFIGSDSQMIAPVEIGDACYVASGSTINQSMPDGAFAIARTRQVTKEGMAKRFIKKKK